MAPTDTAMAEEDCDWCLYCRVIRSFDHGSDEELQISSFREGSLVQALCPKHKKQYRTASRARDHQPRTTKQGQGLKRKDAPSDALAHSPDRRWLLVSVKRSLSARFQRRLKERRRNGGSSGACCTRCKMRPPRTSKLKRCGVCSAAEVDLRSKKRAAESISDALPADAPLRTVRRNAVHTIPLWAQQQVPAPAAATTAAPHMSSSEIPAASLPNVVSHQPCWLGTTVRFGVPACGALAVTSVTGTSLFCWPTTAVAHSFSSAPEPSPHVQMSRLLT